jgi:hypothetical protein
MHNPNYFLNYFFYFLLLLHPYFIYSNNIKVINVSLNSENISVGANNTVNFTLAQFNLRRKIFGSGGSIRFIGIETGDKFF